MMRDLEYTKQRLRDFKEQVVDDMGMDMQDKFSCCIKDMACAHALIDTVCKPEDLVLNNAMMILTDNLTARDVKNGSYWLSTYEPRYRQEHVLGNPKTKKT
jgi:hypothetical protein